jgi:hypothetical protein
MSSQSGDPVYSPHVIDLLKLANEYCLFLEKSEQYKTPDLLVFLQRILPMLYIKGSLLPEVQGASDIVEHFVTEEQWSNIFADLREKFGAADDYYFCDLNDPEGSDPWKGSLADNLSDIYQCMKDFILLFQKNTYSAQKDAVADVSSLFKSHWGECATRAHNVIHHLVFQSVNEATID